MIIRTLFFGAIFWCCCSPLSFGADVWRDCM